MDVVNVELGQKSYPIMIGPNSLSQIGPVLKELNLAGKILVVSDEQVGKIYGDPVLEQLSAAGFTAELLLVPPGEGTKSLEIAQLVFTRAITMGLDRRSPIAALGGGVVGDLTGFIAATYLRGIPLIQLPTSLLAQVDSSVGGKVAVNHPLGKNLIGAFYQPRAVIIDIQTVSTLPERELATGLAEVIKHGLIADAALFTYLQINHRQITGRDAGALTHIIKRSCEIKAGVVEQDEREAGLRMILNFGHTIAHAIEATAGYGRYNHGEAVAIGMHGAALISCYLGLCTPALVAVVKSAISKYRLPLTADDCAPADILSLLTRDKKTVGGKVHWVLLTDIGKVVIRNNVPDEVVSRALTELT
ncbi:3-dehydroquinate synthase|uniref:3-dehydroquinate synthase n=1 Tax=Dendrosporobacter quercicolus TaxID=146817 RepID=A0A1G9LFI8_9FIRM|nr:3-dehydroquinate synthase [Dendrosporobacter quercicolus]NSL46696.1 3-dehydroquinate synthase [Dendrosporobacter quercicolus DSM 1736]SDL60698.1 3-dehydroquinate synthase [Dendrosporobacter quercicolus]